MRFCPPKRFSVFRTPAVYHTEHSWRVSFRVFVSIFLNPAQSSVLLGTGTGARKRLLACRFCSRTAGRSSQANPKSGPPFSRTTRLSHVPQTNQSQPSYCRDGKTCGYLSGELLAITASSECCCAPSSKPFVNEFKFTAPLEFEFVVTATSSWIATAVYLS